MTRVYWGLLALFLLMPAYSGTDRYRAMWRDNPATTMVIGWDQQSGTSPILYYDTTDHGTNTGAYAFQQAPDRSVSYKGMENRFVRLSGLAADTVYYFVIQDSNSTSARMKFRTAPADDSPFTAIAGGDSRNNWDVRINANKMAAKLKPLFIMFGGDMTSGDSSSEWQTWMDHWQETITSDGRLIPVIAARGNHENNNTVISSLFDSPQANIYFALTFGQDMLRTYTLNSEDVEGGNQASWLSGDLAANQQVSWRFAQYHKPMRPHESSKSEGNSEYNAWAQLFYDYKVQLIVECDSHVVKSTWPVRPFTGSGSDEGFIRDDENGSVYVGEGTWGAPLRSGTDTKTWTRENGSLNQFKWLNVTRSQVVIKTVQYGNVASVGEVNEASPYTPPAGISFWGSTLELNAATAPTVALTSPSDGALYNSGDSVSISANASSPTGSISHVRFYVDGSLISQDSQAPYAASWTASGNGNHTITATATDNLGDAVSQSVSIQVGVATIQKRIAVSSDDAEERSTGSMYLNSSDLELVYDQSNQDVGLRFTDIQIPQGATISSASIQFTVDETSSGSTDLVVRGQASSNPSTFTSSSGNISSRATTSAFVDWSPSAWSSVGSAGAAQQTPNLAAVVQEITDRGDWTSGNAMVFIINGTGERVAEAYDGVSSSAPLLSITYTSGGGSTNTPPAASFTRTINNLTVDFQDTSTDTDGTITSRSWNFGDGNTASTQNPSHSYGAAGSYTVSLTVTDNDGASHSTSQNVTVSAGNSAPTADFTYVANGLTVNFTDDSSDPDGSIASRSWDFGDGNSSTAQNPSHTYASAGTYTVSISVTDNQGAGDSVSDSITVTASNSAPTASFTHVANDLTVTFTDGSSDPDGSIASRSWDFGDGNSSTTQNPSHSYASAGTYTVALTVTDNQGASDTVSNAVTVTSSSNGCDAGLNSYSGNLTGSNDSEVQPNGTYFYHTGGVLVGHLTGPQGTDFDLRLRFWSGSWKNVASSLSSSSIEDISYDAPEGYYYWRIESYSGSGDYLFCSSN